MSKGMQMIKLNLYKYSKALSVISLIAVTYKYWGFGFWEAIFILLPYLLVFLLANRAAYSSPLLIGCRAIAGVIVSLLCAVLLFGITPSAQAGIGFMFVVVIQYGVIFVSEALIGLFTYQADDK
tara:strand:+ start:280 stop:651 length:372 start_codon:yes stop_codon:yes gene_type:complete